MSKLVSLHDLASHEQLVLRTGGRRSNGLPSGICLEKFAPGGIPRGMVTTVYSQEGCFKTTMVTHMAHAIASAGHKVVFVTLEDSAQLCAHRMLGRMTGVAAGLIHGGTLTAEQSAVVTEAALSEASHNVLIVDDVEPTMARCFDAVRAVPGCAALIVDYVQLLGGHDQKATLDAAMRDAQQFARVMQIAVIFVSQQVKPNEHREDPRPKSEDMFGSSALRMGSKVALGIFRPWNWCKVPTQPKGLYGPYCKWISANPELHAPLYANLLEIHCTKNVLGAPGAYHVLVDPQRGVVSPYSLAGYI